MNEYSLAKLQLCIFAAVFLGAQDIFAQILLTNLHLKQRKTSKILITVGVCA